MGWGETGVESAIFHLQRKECELAQAAVQVNYKRLHRDWKGEKVASLP
jgi:hypothetical protein